MKRLFALLTAFVMALALSACGGDTPGTDDTTTPPQSDGSKIDVNEVVQDALEEAEELDSFSVEAVERFLSKGAGLELSALEPDWEWELPNKYCAYADDPASSYGHAVIQFTRTEGENSEADYDAWLEKVFGATAAASQDGHNIVGYEFAGSDRDPMAEVTLEEATSGFIQGWGFRYNDRNMVVYVSEEYDSDKDSTLGRLLYHNGVEVDIGFGVEMSWDDVNDYLEENQEEIDAALKDYFG